MTYVILMEFTQEIQNQTDKLINIEYSNSN